MGVLCGICRQKCRTIPALFKHWAKTGEGWSRPLWEKYSAARRRGASGHRILTRIFPAVKGDPMPEEVKDRLRSNGSSA